MEHRRTEPAPGRLTAADVVDIESVGVEEAGRVFYAWLRLADQRGALFEWDLRAPLGQQQRLTIIEGA